MNHPYHIPPVLIASPYPNFRVRLPLRDIDMCRAKIRPVRTIYIVAALSNKGI